MTTTSRPLVVLVLLYVLGLSCAFILPVAPKASLTITQAVASTVSNIYALW